LEALPLGNVFYKENFGMVKGILAIINTLLSYQGYFVGSKKFLRVGLLKLAPDFVSNKTWWAHI
jgi:hypothetical protein